MELTALELNRYEWLKGLERFLVEAFEELKDIKDTKEDMETCSAAARIPITGKCTN